MALSGWADCQVLWLVSRVMCERLKRLLYCALKQSILVSASGSMRVMRVRMGLPWLLKLGKWHSCAAAAAMA